MDLITKSTEFELGAKVRLIDQHAADFTGKRVGDLGEVRMTRETSKRFFWVEFADGALAPYEAHELALASERYIPAPRRAA